MPFNRHPYLVVPKINPQNGFPLEVHFGVVLSAHLGFPLTQLLGSDLVVVKPPEDELDDVELLLEVVEEPEDEEG